MSQSVALSPSLAPLARPAISPWLIAIAVMTATFMEVLDTTIVNVALDHIGGSLSVTYEEATWALTSYLVANAVVLPATGFFSNYFGRKRFLMACIVIFTIASGLCGAATSMPMLIVARILQGAGGGALQPISQAVLLESFPPKKRGVAMAVFGLGVVAAPIVGPTLGGWITDNYSWRWVFYVNLPVGVIAMLMIQAFIHDPSYIRRAVGARIDYFGFGLLALWIGCLQIVLDKGQQDDWFASPLIRTLLVVAIVGLIVWVTWELRAKSPLVNLRILTNRNFVLGTALMTILGALLYGMTALLPLFLQTLLGYTATQSGLTLSPRGFGSIFGMLVIGRIIGLIDSRVLICGGFAILGFSTMELGNISMQISPANVTWPTVYNGLGTALIFVPLTTVTMGTLELEQMGNATGIFNLMRNLGGGIGIAMVTTLIARDSQAHQAFMVSHLTPYSPAYIAHAKAISGALTSQLGGYNARHAAQGMVYGQLVQQATLKAYVDNFRNLGLIAFLCMPLAFVFKRAKRRGPISVH